jgi:hypothetical protein
MLRTKPESGQMLHAPSGPRSGSGSGFWHMMSTRFLRRAGSPPRRKTLWMSMHLLRRSAHQAPHQVARLAAPDSVPVYAASTAIASIRAMRFRSMA